MSSMEMKIGFSVEPADRGVGIMSEGFAAWVLDGTCWCNLVDIEAETFEWFVNEGGELVARPADAVFVEQALLGFAHAYYANEDGDDVDELHDGRPA